MIEIPVKPENAQEYTRPLIDFDAYFDPNDNTSAVRTGGFFNAHQRKGGASPMALFENLRSPFSPNVAYVYGGGMDVGVRVAGEIGIRHAPCHSRRQLPGNASL